MKRLLILVAILSVLVASCNMNDELNESRGRGDAPSGWVDDTPKDIIQMPDRFSNVAHACDGYGHRVFVTTKSDHSRQMEVIDDPTCTAPDNEGNIFWSGTSRTGDTPNP